jgi:hypothetical protein
MPSSIVMSSLKGQCHEIFDFRFFHESVPTKPLSIRKFEITVMLSSEAWGKMIYEKKPEAKNLVTLSKVPRM